MNFQAICRVCARESSGMLSIFESYNFPAHNYEIFKAITDCASIQIQKFDGFSEQICRRCLDHLTQAYSFKTLCEDSDYKFRTDLIVSDKINIKNEFPNAEFTCCETDAIENIATNASVIDNRLANGNTEEIKTENKSKEDEFRIQELEAARLSTTVTERTGYEGPSSLKPPQYIEEAMNGSPYECELCSICRIHREQFSEESNNQFRNEYIMTKECKSEFSSDDTVIRYGDGDYKNPDNITNVGLTQVEKETSSSIMSITRKELYGIMRSSGCKMFEDQFAFLTGEIITRTKCNQGNLKALKCKLSVLKWQFKSRWMKADRTERRFFINNKNWLDLSVSFLDYNKTIHIPNAANK